MAGCITDEVLAAWAIGTATPDVVSSIQDHIASCASCRTVAAEVARTAGSRPKPKSLGRYELQEPVGAGGMGTVFSAWDPTLSRRVAVKLLHEAAVDSHRAERFHLERQVLGGLEHPHIARLLDAGETEEGQPWFAMDFIDGKPLDEACDAAKLTPQQRVELMLPVLRAVTAAHQHLVVHRDLKPSNILVDKNGEPHLVDFGIARLLEGASGLTQTGVTPMTPAYASPEQVRREPVAVTTDVYSLGVVLYEVLTGVSPYETKPGDVEGVLAAITRAEVKLPSEAVLRATASQVAARGLTREKLRSALQGDLDAIVMMALRKDPQDRYQSVQALTDDLVAALERRPTLARRGDRAYRAARFVRRNRALVAGVSAAFVALTVGLVATVWQARRAETERDLAQARFNQVRQLAKAVLFRYHDGIADLPGSTALRQELVKDAQGYLEALSAQAANDLALKQELATSYLKLGDVQGDPFTASLGDTSAAKESYLKARALAESILVSHPTDWDARRTLAQSHEKLGSLEEVTGSLETALGMLLEGLALDAKLLDERPDDLDQRFWLGRDELGVGQVLMDLGRLGESKEHLQRSLDLRAEVAAKRNDPASRRGVTVALISLSRVATEEARLDDAIELALRAEAQGSALVAESPGSVEMKRTLQVAWQVLIGAYRLAGRFADALPYARKSTAAARAAYDGDPGNSVAARDLVVALTLEGGLLSSLNRLEETRALEHEALELLRASHQRDPANMQTLRNLGRQLVASAYDAAWRGEFDTAERRLVEQAKIAAELKARDAQDFTTLEELTSAHDVRAIIFTRQGRFTDALAEQQQVLDETLAQTGSSPESKRLWTQVGHAQAALVKLRVRIAEKSKAKADWEAALAQEDAAARAVAEIVKDDSLLSAFEDTIEERAELKTRIEAALAGKPLPPLPPL